VKTFWLALLLVTGCGWRQRDFEKDMSKHDSDGAPQVDVTDKKLLEKFETKEIKTQPATTVKATTPEPVTTTTTTTTTITDKKTAKKKVVVKTVSKKVVVNPKTKKAITTVKEKVKKLPADYPPALLEMNKKAEKVWELFRPNLQSEERIFLDIHYMGITVGKIMSEYKGKVMVGGKEVHHFHARFKSAPFYSNIYELDDTVDTYVGTEQFLTMKYTLIQRESKQDIDDLQLFDRDQMKLFWFYKRKKSDGDIKNKETQAYIPYFSIDPFSVLFFYQGLPLNDNDVYEIPILNKDKIMMLYSKVEGREKIDTERGEKLAIRVHSTTQYTGETLKSGDLTFWFSDDEKRTLLKAKAKIKLGSVTADIVK
jgi:hypothetical protein